MVCSHVVLVMLLYLFAGSGMMPVGAQPVQRAPGPERAQDEIRLAAFAEAAEEWGEGPEAIIEKAYRACFRTYILDGKVLTLRMPFAQNNERSELAETNLEVLGGGKADPIGIWESVDALFLTEDFKRYLAALSDGRKKGISFDLEKRSWSIVSERFYIERMESGEYPGLPNRPFVLVSGRGGTVPDIYNYIYCIGRLGMDCSGFVWFALKILATAGGLDLDKALLRATGAPRKEQASLYAGTRFFDPRNKAVREIEDEIGALLPGDVLLFRAEDGEPLHSALIQSIDLAEGRIRYLQSTDEALRDERGVHESFILFDPRHPEASLRDPELIWMQRREAAFSGEILSAYADDGERYRTVTGGGGTVVRVRVLEKVVARLSTKR